MPPPERGSVTNVALLDAVPGLRLCDRDWRALASMRHPVKVALWLAMMRPVEELFAREGMVETTQDGEVQSIPAALAWAETVMRRAIRGDMQASSMIADRFEGKVGTRRDEEDPEESRRRGDIQAVIESVVTSLVNTRIAGGEALDITPVESSMDSERQDSDTRSSLQEERQREEQDNQERGQTLAETNDSPEERDLTDPSYSPPYTNGHS